MPKDHPDPIEALRAAARAPFARAHAMPPEVYTSNAFLAEEIAHVFRREWYCAGRADALREPGDYTAFDLAGEPVVVVRDGEGVLRAMSNVCRHRMSTLLEGTGRTRSIVCPYHAWTYGLDGRLRGAPAMCRNERFRREDHVLPPVRCEEWLGWIFVTLDSEAAPVGERLAEVEAMIADYDMARYTEAFREEHVWKTNWKVLAENFMESYHLPICHAGTIGGLSRLEDMVCPPGRPAFNYHTILKDESLRIAMAHPSNHRLEGDARRTTFLLAVYPSLMVTLTPGYFWYLSLHPRGPGQVHIRFGGGMSDDFADDPDAPENFAALKSLLDDVNAEDRGCTERVYRGLCAGLARPGPLSHLERPNYDFARYLIERIDMGRATIGAA